MNELQKHIVRVGLLLGVFAIVATTLVALTEANTREQIAENEREALLKAVSAVVPADRYNNDILQDTLTLSATEALGTEEETVIYRGRQNGDDAVAVLTVIAPNGYSGKIKLLVGIDSNATLTGVRVISHKETPGLGDKIDEKKDEWILQFAGLSLTSPSSALWKVKKDNGAFDQFTGATITPRAVVSAVKSALEYFEKHRDALFITKDNA
jgi:electron transport complex protein RnfG